MNSICVREILTICFCLLCSTHCFALHGYPIEKRSVETDDGSVRITLSLDRDTLSPGELLNITVDRKLCKPDDRLYPNGQALEISIMTPSNEHIVSKYRRDTTGLEFDDEVDKTLAELRVWLAPPGATSGGWFRKGTRERVDPDFSQVGTYTVYTSYVAEKPANRPNAKWSGKMECPTLTFTVRQMPLAQRMMDVTDAHKPLIQYLERAVLGNELPAAPPVPLSVVSHLLDRTECEGLAIRIVELLHKADRNTRNQWPCFYYLRAVRRRAFLENALRIRGPYLSKLVQLEIDTLRGACEDSTVPLTRTPHNLLIYLRDNKVDKREARLVYDQLTEIATRNSDKPFLYVFLLSLNILKDGMLRSDAISFLGPPSYEDPNGIRWGIVGSREYIGSIWADKTDEINNPPLRFVRAKPIERP